MTRVWPFFDLVVRTPRLELRGASDDLLEELTAVMARGVYDPGPLPFDDPSSFYEPSPTREWRWLRGQWGARANLGPDQWTLTFAVIVDGRAVGVQEMSARSFPALRTVSTYSWLDLELHGRGIGKEMRAAVLHLSFAGLNAERAESEAFADNAPSRGVSLALGYELNGITWALRQSRPAPMERFLLTSEAWEPRRRHDIELIGLAPCLDLLGLSAPTD